MLLRDLETILQGFRYKSETKFNHMFWFYSYIKLYLVTRLIKLGIFKAQIEFVIKIHNVGMFASFNWILFVGLYCEKFHINNFLISYPDKIYRNSFSRNSNWIEGILIPRNSERPRKRKVRISISSIRSLPGIRTETLNLDLIKANQIFYSLFDISEKVLQSVSDFMKREITNSYLAIHLRGTDKQKEAELVPVSKYVETLANLIDRSQKNVIDVFVASDEKGLIEEISIEINRQFPNCKVLSQKGILRSLDGKPIHLGGNASTRTDHDIAIEALTEALILSKSSILIRNASFLSGWASIFNPNLNVVMLNAPDESKNWFPDSFIRLNQFRIDSNFNTGTTSKPLSGL
jgi:hypothetical protein